jgi:hypothetical protein
MEELTKYEFDKSVRRYCGDPRVRTLSAHGQFLVMDFTQLADQAFSRAIQQGVREPGTSAGGANN